MNVSLDARGEIVTCSIRFDLAMASDRSAITQLVAALDLMHDAAVYREIQAAIYRSVEAKTRPAGEPCS